MSFAPSDGSTRIIIADDHEWIRQIIIDVVRQTLPEAEVIATKDGLQAFQAFERGGCHFLITNHAMPHMDGMTLIRQLREQGSEVPIVMVSVKPEAEADAMMAGANWFLRKEHIMERLPALLLQYTGTGVAVPSAIGKEERREAGGGRREAGRMQGGEQ